MLCFPLSPPSELTLELPTSSSSPPFLFICSSSSSPQVALYLLLPFRPTLPALLQPCFSTHTHPHPHPPPLPLHAYLLPQSEGSERWGPSRGSNKGLMLWAWQGAICTVTLRKRRGGEREITRTFITRQSNDSAQNPACLALRENIMDSEEKRGG